MYVHFLQQQILHSLIDCLRIHNNKLNKINTFYAKKNKSYTIWFVRNFAFPSWGYLKNFSNIICFFYQNSSQAPLNSPSPLVHTRNTSLNSLCQQNNKYFKLWACKLQTCCMSINYWLSGGDIALRIRNILREKLHHLCKAQSVFNSLVVQI